MRKENFSTPVDLKRVNVNDDFYIPNDMTEFLIYGYGSDGMVSTSKDIIKIIGDHICFI